MKFAPILGFLPLLAALQLSACLDANIRLGAPLSSPRPSASPSGAEAGPQAEVVTAPIDHRSVDPAVINRWIVVYTNQARQAHQLPALKEDGRLAEVATAHSKNMGDNSFFDHVDPAGNNHQNRLDQRYPGLVNGSGENIARYPVVQGGDQELARLLVEGWMNSPGHRANILKADYTAIGAGIAQTGIYVYATQDFAQILNY